MRFLRSPREELSMDEWLRREELLDDHLEDLKAAVKVAPPFPDQARYDYD
jgi:hypothetical protein